MNTIEIHLRKALSIKTHNKTILHKLQNKYNKAYPELLNTLRFRTLHFCVYGLYNYHEGGKVTFSFPSYLNFLNLVHIFCSKLYRKLPRVLREPNLRFGWRMIQPGHLQTVILWNRCPTSLPRASFMFRLVWYCSI